MSGRRRLRAGQPRLLGKHHGAAGAAFRRWWAALCSELGEPARGSLIAMEMGRTVLALMRAETSARSMIEAQHQRDTGRGRRPSAGLVNRLVKRAALDEGSASAMLDRLRTLAPKPGDAFAERVRNGHAAG